jgi:hypothetical protein
VAVRRGEDVLRRIIRFWPGDSPLKSGTCTAIWSPSKSALNAARNERWIWIVNLDQHRHERRMLRRCRVGARFSSTGWSDDLVEGIPDLGPAALDHALGRLDVGGVALVDELSA